METKRPKVSMIFPSIRTDKFAIAAERSVLMQTLGDIQILKDSVRRGSNSASLNACLDKAKGDLVCFAYDDDLNMLNKCEIFSMYAEKYPDIDVFFTSRIMINDKGKICGYFVPPDFDIDMFTKLGNYISTMTCCVRRDAIGDLRFNNDFPITHEYLFFYELHKKGSKFKMIDVPLGMTRIHKGQMSSFNHEKKIKEHVKLKEHLNNEDVYSQRRYSKSYMKNIAGNN